MQHSRRNRRTDSSARRRGAAIIAVLAAFGVAGVAEAQQASAGGGRLTRASGSGQRSRSLTGAGPDLSALPMRLLDAPEGRALMRFKKDMEEMGALMESPRAGQSGGRLELDRIRGVERNVDSLMRVFVQLHGENGGGVRTIELRPGG